MYVFANNKIELGFGDKEFRLEDLKKYQPEKKICTLKQVHGDRIVFATPNEELPGDAHFSLEEDLVLVIKTADCIPAMLYNPITETIAAIHAGWRGIAKRILPLSIEKICPTKHAMASCMVWIGPHIQKKSFEVEIDVIEELQRSTEKPSSYFFTDIGQGKFLVDLNSIVLQQMKESGLREENITFIDIDTFSDDAYFSYRKGDKNKRLYSYIFKN